jgi:rhodanese-related sulfurtransferase
MNAPSNDIVDIDIEAVKKGLAEGTMLLVDVREPHEFAAGHIPGAVLFPLSTFDPVQLPDPQGKELVFSCRTGARTLKAIALAQAAGLPYRAHYKGSFMEWVAAGEPVAEVLD